jgi:mannose-6-phosphate isomerase-like protein (cupin superfamily)
VSSRLLKTSSEAAFKSFSLELIGPADDRGYSKFNRIRGLLCQKFGMTHFCPTTKIMIKKSIATIPPFTAGDHTLIREVLHPKNDGVPMSYSLAHAELEAGKASLPDRLMERSEVYIILEGEGTAYVDGQATHLQAGDVLFIPAGAEQYVDNTGTQTVRFLCIVDPAWSEESEIVK